MSWLLNQGADEGIVEGSWTSSANADGSEETLVRLGVPASLKRTGKDMKFIFDGVANSAPRIRPAFDRSCAVRRSPSKCSSSNCPPLEGAAHEEGITPSYASRVARLKFLAPDIVATILAGKQPPDLTANKLMADTRLPLDWRDQRAALGIA